MHVPIGIVVELLGAMDCLDKKLWAFSHYREQLSAELVAQTSVCDSPVSDHRLTKALNKLVRDCLADVGLISPFSLWEKGRGRGAKLGRLDTQALSPTLSQRERESGQTKQFVWALKPNHRLESAPRTVYGFSSGR
jgi:hypothetical protein